MTSAFKPPKFDFDNVIDPPYNSRISLMIDRPIPLPGLLWSRLVPLVKTVSNSEGGIPGPSSSTIRTLMLDDHKQTVLNSE